MLTKINLNGKFALFTELWRPKVVASLNGQEVKIIKVKGEFPWHRHDQEDELFLVWKGNFRVEFRDQVVSLEAGECIVVPHGIEHRTCAEEEAEITIGDLHANAKKLLYILKFHLKRSKSTR